jgi:hypothetical protein
MLFLLVMSEGHPEKEENSSDSDFLSTQKNE